MFEESETGNVVTKAEYKEQSPPLRLELLKLQFRLRKADFPVIVVLAGDDRVGRNELLHLLSEWLDPRYVETNAMGLPTGEERERPGFWRYWRRLPANGRIGTYLGGWTTFGILARIRGEIDDDGLERWARQVRDFEDMLVDDGAVLVKIWTHIPKKALKKRLEEAEKCPDELWNIGEADREIFENYDVGSKAAERIVRGTSRGRSPWHVVESTDRRACNLAFARILARAISRRMDRPALPEEPPPSTLSVGGPEAERTVLDAVDLTRRLEKDEYQARLNEEQAAIHRLTDKAARKKIGSVLVFEGWDASGKGGAVRRLNAAVMPARIQVVPIAAPTDEERAHHYLWRFWRRLPQAGHVTVFDRSWYGRVLVERVEGFARKDEWQRAFSEIIDFEKQLVRFGYVVHKFWMHVDRDEQLRRFEAREASPLKEWKITPDDWRNREKWDDYAVAVNEMVQRTDTNDAPWTVVASNDKRWARVRVLETWRKRLEDAL